jgi:hypothetical protein
MSLTRAQRRWAIVLAVVVAWPVLFFGGRELLFDSGGSVPPERGRGQVVTE